MKENIKALLVGALFGLLLDWAILHAIANGLY